MSSSLTARRHLLVLALAAALTACGGKPAETAAPAAAAPKAANANASSPAALPQGWLRLAGTDVPSSANLTPVLPVTVTSDDGEQVTVKDASRIVAGGDDVLLDLVYVHWLLFPYFSPAQMSNSAKQCERIDHIDYGAYFSIAFDETAAKNRRASKNP